MLSKKILGISESLTLGINAKSKAMQQEGRKIYNLAAGEPDFNIFENIKMAGIKSIQDNFNRYTPTAGNNDLRDAIVNKFVKENNVLYKAEEVMVSNGAKQILANIFFALANKGDEFILPAPYWTSYIEQIKMVGGVPRIVDLINFKVKASFIEKHINKRTKAIVLNYPSNPTGVTIEKSELKKIADLAVKNNIIIISDEVYEHFIFDNRKHISIASLNRKIKEKTITVNAVSKTYSMTGLRLGYCAGPLDIIKAMTRLQDHQSSAPSSISQQMAIEALRGSQKEIININKKYQERRDFVVEFFNKIGLTCTKPDGTFYVFPEIKSTKLSSMEFSMKLLEEHGVATVPGIAFGFDENIRVSFVGDEKDLKIGLEKIFEFVKSVS